MGGWGAVTLKNLRPEKEQTTEGRSPIPLFRVLRRRKQTKPMHLRPGPDNVVRRTLSLLLAEWLGHGCF